LHDESRSLVDVGVDQVRPRFRRVQPDVPGNAGKFPVACFGVAGNREGQLLDVILAPDPKGNLPDPLDRRKEESDQYPDDRDYHENFEQAEG
jgi:hypothetical protein